MLFLKILFHVGIVVTVIEGTTTCVSSMENKIIAIYSVSLLMTLDQVMFVISVLFCVFF